MEKTKCLEKYKEYFNDSIREKDIDYFNDTLSDLTGFKNIYNNFLIYKENKITPFYSNNSLVKEDIKALDHTINLVYEKLSKLNNQILLVVGQVQSGKTDFMIGLTCKILNNSNEENEINIIINLTSNSRNLIAQTYERFETFFDEIELNENVEFYDFVKLQQIFKDKKMIENHSIFFLLKNKNHLDSLNHYLNFLSNSKQKFSITILDDEGDNASFNTNLNVNDLSTINKLLNWLIFHNFDSIKTNFISVTATPLIHYFSNLENNLKPDFAFILKPGQGYKGILEYNEEINQFNSNVINKIDFHDSNLDRKNNSLERAIICYLALCALNQEIIFGNKNIKPRMMINMDVKKEQHEILRYQIDQWLREYRNHPNRIEVHLETYNIWPLIKSLFDVNQKNELITNIKNLINKNKYEIIVANSDNENLEEVKFDKSETRKFQIIIGSNKLSRGLTIKNLICAYMSIRSLEGSKVDVLLQRARWFGYHQNNFKYMRIFLTEELIKDYIVSAEIMDNLYKTINYAQKNHLSFKEIERYILVSELKTDLIPLNNRVSTGWEFTSLKNVFIRNKYKNDFDSMEEIFLKFQSDWKGLREEDSDYPIIRFENIQVLINNWFESNINFYKSVDISETEFKKFIINNNIDTTPVYIRLINKTVDLNNMIYKQRQITWKKSWNNEMNFGNGKYAYDDLQESNQIKLDLLPLEIWHKKEEEDEIDLKRKIFRLKLFLPVASNESTHSEYVIKALN